MRCISCRLELEAQEKGEVFSQYKYWLELLFFDALIYVYLDIPYLMCPAQMDALRLTRYERLITKPFFINDVNSIWNINMICDKIKMKTGGQGGYDAKERS